MNPAVSAMHKALLAAHLRLVGPGNEQSVASKLGKVGEGGYFYLVAHQSFIHWYIMIYIRGCKWGK